MDFYAVVVIYNKDIEESKTLASIRDMGFYIIVVDNSKNQKNESYCKKNNFHYIGNQKNIGLSKSYNKAIDYLSHKEGYICIFDDDSTVDKDYLFKLKSSVHSGGTVYLPIIEDEVGLLSPSIIQDGVVTRAKNAADIPQSEITGINTGMAINLSFFKNYRYDENYFLDYIDHNFLRDVKASGGKIALLDSMITPDFSDNGNMSKEAAKVRFRIFKNDFSLFCKDNRALYNKTILKRRLKLALKYKSLIFWK